METKGNKVLCNIKIKWIFMCSLVKGLLVKYHTFLMKTTWNALTITSVKLDLSSFIDVEPSLDYMSSCPFRWEMQCIFSWFMQIDFTINWTLWMCQIVPSWKSHTFFLCVSNRMNSVNASYSGSLFVSHCNFLQGVVN